MMAESLTFRFGDFRDRAGLVLSIGGFSSRGQGPCRCGVVVPVGVIGVRRGNVPQ
jgi:hypothetical protein